MTQLETPKQMILSIASNDFIEVLENSINRNVQLIKSHPHIQVFMHLVKNKYTQFCPLPCFNKTMIHHLKTNAN